MAAVRGARGAVEPVPGAGAGPGPAGGGPEAGVRGGEPGRSSWGLGGGEGRLGFAVPGGGGALGTGFGGLPAVLRVPQGALAVLAEHQPDGAVYPGSAAWDEGAGPQVSQGGGGIQAPLPGVREARGEVGRTETKGVLGGEGGAGEDASGAVCPPYTDSYTLDRTLLHVLLHPENPSAFQGPLTIPPPRESQASHGLHGIEFLCPASLSPNGPTPASSASKRGRRGPSHPGWASWWPTGFGAPHRRWRPGSP